MDASTCVIDGYGSGFPHATGRSAVILLTYLDQCLEIQHLNLPTGYPNQRLLLEARQHTADGLYGQTEIIADLSPGSSRAGS